MFEKSELGSLVERQQGGGTPERNNPRFWNGSIPWASVKDFADDQLALNSTEDSITQQGLAASSTNLIPAGTPLVCTRMAVGRCAISNSDVSINQDVKALFPKANVSPQYLLRVIDSLKFQAENVSVGSTVRGIRISDLLGIQTPIAPPHEQPKIAQILDTLDTQIQKTEALIAKLEKIKEGLLHDLFTRGIDHNGQIRPSPQQAPELYKESALGLIPEEWVAQPIEDLVSKISGGAALKTHEFGSSGVGVIAKSDVTSSKFINISIREQFVPRQVAAAYSKSLVTSSCVIVSLRDLVPSAPTVGMGSQFSGNGEFILAQGTYGLYFNETMLLSYLFVEVTRLPWFRSLAKVLAVGSTQVHIRSTEYLKIKLPRPPLDEQFQIRDRIIALDTRLGTERDTLQKLQLLKLGLADDLLTGNIRVTPLLKDAV